MNQPNLTASGSDPLLEQFVVEAREQLQVASDGLLLLEESPSDLSAVDAVFRSLHTVKGGSGLFDAPALNQVLHETEQLLHSLRSGKIYPDEAILDLLLEVIDQVLVWIDRMAEKGEMGRDGLSTAEDLVSRIDAVLGGYVEGSNVASEDVEPNPFQPSEMGRRSIESVPVEALIRTVVKLIKAGDTSCQLIVMTPDPDALIKGQDPLNRALTLPGCLALGTESVCAVHHPDDMETFRYQLSLVVLSSEARETLREEPELPGKIKKIESLPVPVLFRLEGDARPLAAEKELLAALRSALDNGDDDAFSHAVSAGLDLFDDGLWVYRGLQWLSALHLLDEVPEVWKRELIEAVAVRRQPTIQEFGRLGTGVSEDRDNKWSFSDGTGGLFSDDLPSVHDTDPDVGGLDPAMGGLFEDTPGFPGISPDSSFSERSAVASSANMGASSVVNRRNDYGTGGLLRKGSSHVHVDTDRLDQLGELVGELMVARNGLPYLARRAEQEYGSRNLSREIKDQSQILERVTEELQRAVSAVQMQPVSTTFQRFRRLTRDIARKLNKKVDLVLEGEDTQADRQVLAAMVDPLTHLVRNSLDHGIEMPEERAEAGKPERGCLVLRATHSGDWLQLEVADDGRGVDPERIAKKALEKGVATAEELDNMDDLGKQRLIFAPGFSTAEVVSEVSGRGVGMDAVRDTVESLGGRIDLESQVGEGNRMVLSLPLSMAVSRVLLARCGDQELGVPIEPVVEIVRRPRSEIEKVQHQPVIMVRDEVLPVMRLGDHLGVSPKSHSNKDEIVSFIVLNRQSCRVALEVDDVGEDMEVVVKPLEGLLGASTLFTGNALLGDGRILFILNMKDLLS